MNICDEINKASWEKGVHIFDKVTEKYSPIFESERYKTDQAYRINQNQAFYTEMNSTMDAWNDERLKRSAEIYAKSREMYDMLPRAYTGWRAKLEDFSFYIRGKISEKRFRANTRF